jgi:hypothetical protein
MPIKGKGIRTYFVNSLLTRSGAVLLLLVWVLAAHAQNPCSLETAYAYGSSPPPIRTDSNHVKTYGQTWVTGDVYLVWTPWEEAWQQLNGSNITTGYTSNNNPGSTAQSNWSNILNSSGPGSYRDYSYHWVVPASSCTGWVTDYLGYTTGNTLTITRPTISGVNAFWWLGNGILSDQGYHAQSALTGNANGASGSAYWSVQTVSGGGSVSISCSVCTSNTATSTAASKGCTEDVTIYASYGGFNSDPFKVMITAPSTLTPVSGSPKDQANGDGFKSTYQWGLTDNCNQRDYGLDGNEVLGSWVDDYYNSTGRHNNWRKPTPWKSFNSDYIWQDDIGISNCGGGCSPQWSNPKPTLSTVKVMSAPFSFYIGTQTSSSGIKLMSNTTQFYLDHGRHQ